MQVRTRTGQTKYGPGVDIELTGDEVAQAIDAYLKLNDVHISGGRTIRVNGELCSSARVYVDPSGFVVSNGQRYSGQGSNET